ncbi:hypothetical protein V8E52_005069 [Russula decolorans]
MPHSTLTRNMSVDTFNDVLDTAMMEEPNEEVNFPFMNNSGTTGQEISTDPALLEGLQFGNAVEQFGYTSNPPFWCYPNGIGNGTFTGEKPQGASSMDQNTFADADQFLSSWSGDTTPSDHGDSSPHSSNTSLGAGDLRVGNSQTFSDINQDAQLYGGDETKDIGLAMEDDSTSEMEPSTDLSQADPSPFDPQTACSESTQSGSAPAGWSYRQVLEIVALPPPEGQHLWHTKVSQLAADLGMPSRTTGKDIVNFVLRIATVKNELHRVTPLVKALAAAARVLEGRLVAPTTLLPAVVAQYPSARPLCSIAAVGAANHVRVCAGEEEEKLKD